MNAFNVQKLKYVNDTIPYIGRIIKKAKYSDDDLKEIMKDEEKLQEFSEFLYKELPMHLKVKIKMEDFVTIMNAKAKEELKKPKNKKLVFGSK